jgi:hypothetical protein
MADYEVKAPPNLRSVDCCASCRFIDLTINRDSINREGLCNRFRETVKPWQVEGSNGLRHLVRTFNICDAFEREVRA